MIWRKTWMETRIRVYWSLFIVAVGLVLQLTSAPRAIARLTANPAAAARMLTAWPGAIPVHGIPATPSQVWWQVYLQVATIFATMIGLLMSGSGVNTQTVYGMRCGAHPSMIYTLSLPVRRRTWLAVRAGLGLLWMVGLIVALVLIPPATAVFTHGVFSWGDALATVPSLLLGSTFFFAFAVLLASFLDELWQGLLSMVGVAVAVGAQLAFPHAGSGLFPLMTGETPLPGAAIVWIAATVAMFYAAVQVVERREF